MCQTTAFSVIQDPFKLANKNYSEGNYAEAIEQYKKALTKNSDDPAIRVKLAQSYYRVKEYRQTILTYDAAIRAKSNSLSQLDLYYYAQAQTALQNYTLAIDFYKRCLEHEPDNELIAKKIWRLNNLQYLYEDSAHYAIRPVKFNTNFGELCPVPYQSKIIFTSNRREVKLIETVNGKSNEPFYQLYAISLVTDTATQINSFSDRPNRFAKTLSSKLNTGPAAFYNKGLSMVFVSSLGKNADGSSHNLGLFFASLKNGKWKMDYEYIFNNSDYSITDVTISEEGKKMFFSSNMKGGYGGKDIYVSVWVDGRWSKPRNVGEAINTNQNEVFPYLYPDGTLYFSSDGHAGLGELDIYKVQVKSDGYTEPQNIGYPLNSSYDDFGIAFDSLGSHGYVTSNRMNGGFDDDIYEFDMDLQTYPFTITGVLKYREHTWTDQSAIQTWPNAKVLLFDSWQGTSVYENTTDDDGNFLITIPYFSKFYVQIIDENGDVYKASLEIQKYRALTNVHEIVIVKDIFK